MQFKKLCIFCKNSKSSLFKYKKKEIRIQDNIWVFAKKIIGKYIESKNLKVKTYKRIKLIKRKKDNKQRYMFNIKIK